MHEYRRFIHEHLDSRGWKQADLVRKSGLSRQLVNSILKDTRDYLGQMPDESTLEGIAKGFSVPVELVRTAAARSLAGYTDDGSALTLTLQDVHIDALLNEIRRRIHELEAATESSTPAEGGQAKEGLVPKQSNQRGRRASIDSDVGTKAKDAGVDGTQDGKQGHDLPGA